MHFMNILGLYLALHLRHVHHMAKFRHLTSTLLCQCPISCMHLGALLNPVHCAPIAAYFRGGLYPVALPSGLGVEGAGTVEAVGEGVTHVRPGARVAYISRPDNGPAFAEYSSVPGNKASVAAAVLYMCAEGGRLAAADHVGVYVQQVCTARTAFGLLALVAVSVCDNWATDITFITSHSRIGNCYICTHGMTTRTLSCY